MNVVGTGSDYWIYVDKIKQYFIDHRLTPSSALWSGGLTAGSTFAQPYISARNRGHHRHEHAHCDFALDAVELGYHHDVALLEQSN